MGIGDILDLLASNKWFNFGASLASILSLCLTIFISWRLGTINRKIRFSALQKGWFERLKTLTSSLAPLLGDEVGNCGEIRERLSEAQPILEAVSDNMSMMTKRHWKIRQDAKHIGRLLGQGAGAEGARRHYERLIQTRQHLSETIKQSKVFEA